MVAHIFNPSTWEAKAGSSLWVPGEIWLQWGPVLHKQTERERGREKSKQERRVKRKERKKKSSIKGLNRLLSIKLIMHGHKNSEIISINEFYSLCSHHLKQKAVDGNTVSILPQLSKLSLQPPLQMVTYGYQWTKCEIH